jgi:hypothetical protein
VVRTRDKFFWSALVVLAAVIMVAGAALVAFADNVTPDGDTANPGNNIVYQDPSPNQQGCSARGSAVAGQVQIVYNGSSHFTAGEAVTVTLTPDNVGISASSSPTNVPGTWDTNGQDFNIPISTTTAASVPQGTWHVGVHLHGNSSGYEPNDKQYDVTINTSCPVATSNTAPFAAFDAGQPSSATEGDTKAFNFTITDAEGGPFSFVSGYPDCGSGNTLVSSSITGLTGTFNCKFVDGLSPAVDSTVSVQVQDPGPLTSNVATTDVTVNNANPSVVVPSWVSSTINCRATATLQGISFSDAGVIDYPWSVNINWGGSESPDTNYNTNTQGSQSNQSHIYNTPGTYTATVGVTDKDAGYGSNTSPTLTVLQTYTVRFLQPLDGLTPSNLIVNTMKNGRTVPVKATIYDDCAQAYVTGGSGKSITVKVKNANFTSSPGATDPVESYSDAGASSGNTTSFRWTADSTVAGGGFWIYNLDSSGTGFGLTTNTTYEVHVVVNGACQNNTYALLKPVK